MVQTVQKHTVIGQRVPDVDGLAKVTGQAQYAADVKLPGLLHARLLRSPYAHAKIKRIDGSRALQLPGVKAVVTGADFPQASRTAQVPMGEVEIGMYYMSKLMMARDKALFHGHPVAAVAAITPELAEQALDLIEVDYEPLPVVLDPLEAMKPEAPLLHEDVFTQGLAGRSERPSNLALHMQLDRGDIEAGFKTADAIVEHTFASQVINPGYIEPDADTAMVYPDGKIDIWPNTRGIFFHRNQVAVLLEIDPGRIRVNPTELGGAFGGKMYALLSPICVRLSEKTGRPVRITLDRDEVLRATPPGTQAVISIKIGARKDGRITAMQGHMVYDAGALPGSAVSAGVLSGFAPYKAPNMKIEGFDVVTNKPRVGSVRAPGAPVSCFATECVIDEVAEAIGMDPLEFRLKNAVETGDPQPNNISFTKIGLKELIGHALKHPAWTTPLPEGKNRGRGVAVGFWRGGANTSSCHITVTGDGTVHLTVGTVDMTPARTGFAQICADTLQLPLEKVRVKMGDTDTVAHSDNTGGSRTTYTMGTAIYLASHELIQQMKQRASQRLGVAPEHIEYSNGVFHVSDIQDKSISFKEIALLSVRGGSTLLARGTNPALKAAPAFCLHIVDVEVDPETGKVTILKYTACEDVGRAINPTMVEGQMQGAAVQASGWALTEEMMFDQQGVLRNPTLLDYRMPTALDVPMIATEIVEVPAEDGPFGARGVGEVGVVPVAAAISNAIYRAAGVRLRTLPMNPERVLAAIKAKEAAKKESKR